MLSLSAKVEGEQITEGTICETANRSGGQPLLLIYMSKKKPKPKRKPKPMTDPANNSAYQAGKPRKGK